jgi:chromosome segregation ATPase
VMDEEFDVEEELQSAYHVLSDKQAEIEKLAKQRDYYHDAWKEAQRDVEIYASHLNASIEDYNDALDENKKLREALKEIYRICPKHLPDENGYSIIADMTQQALTCSCVCGDGEDDG